MYRVTIINDGIETEIHSPHLNGLKLSEGNIKRELNKVDSFDISFSLNNPAYGKMKPFLTFINVVNIIENKTIFEGRVLRPTDDMDSEGMHSSSFICEGELAYLHDSQQRHLEYRGTPKNLLITILDYHNKQVEDYKHFEIGEFTVTNSTDNSYVYLSAEQDTFDAIFDKIIDRIGGELRIRKINGVRYLDLVQRIGEDSDTQIRIAKNLKSISRERDPTEIITRLTPLGARIESEDEEATDASEARITVEEVNNGLPYIDAPELIDEFGIQGGSETWDDINYPNILMSTGQRWLRDQKTSYTKYTVDAVDLSIIGKEDEGFDVGNTYPVFNPVMGIDERLRVIGKSININAPEGDQLTIGDKFRTLKEYQSEARKAANKVIGLERTVEGQRRTISNIRNEVNTVKGSMESLQEIIGDADIPGLEGAVSELADTVVALDAAIDSIPIYEPATYELDGLQTSENLQEHDAMKIKLDLISLVNSVDLDELQSKMDLLSVTQSINLDQLYQDVETLKGSDI